jgi:hypothetical protein
VKRLSIQKHNRSKVVLPRGKTRADAKLALPASSLSERARQMAYFALDQADDFVITAAAIARAWAWGWRKYNKARDELIAAGILEQVREPLGDGSSCWHLNFDFTVLFARELSTPTAETVGSHARARDPTTVGGSRDVPTEGDQNLNAPKTKTTTAARPVGGGENREAGQEQVDARSVGIALRGGLSGAAARRFAHAACGASAWQVELLQQLVERPPAGGAGTGWFIRLAQLAARGELEAPRMAPGSADAVAASSPEAVARQRLAAWAGRELVERCDARRAWRVEAGGWVRGADGVLVSPATAAALVTALDEGRVALRRA